MKNDPKYIITNDGKIYKFNAWYVFSIHGVPGSDWPGAQVIDKYGKSFGIHVSNIKAKIYEADEYNTNNSPNRKH